MRVLLDVGLGISDEKIVSALRFLADVEHSLFMVLLHMQFGFFPRHHHRGFVGGHDHLIALVGCDVVLIVFDKQSGPSFGRW